MESEAEDPGAWARARELFLDLAELGPDERTAALARLDASEPALARRVRGLLERDPGAERAPTDDPVSRRFGPYEATRRIAAGGMGEVFLGRRADGEFERDVAIKLLRCTFRGDELLRRFQRERQTLAALDHEYVARLLDGGTTPEGEPYLVMEYVEGLPLDRHCRELRLDLRARLELFLRVLAAVRHAHERGIVHRDLKPSNVLVRADGTPRLLDFGISRPTDDAATPGGPLTRTGHRLFTPEYASPEQVRGGEVTFATDVFALGVMLYELVAGARPFAAELSLHELEQAILHEDPVPPSRRRTGTARRALAGDVDTIVLKCLAKAPSERYASATDLSADLDLHLRGHPIRARRRTPWQRAVRFARRRPGRVIAAAALVGAVVAGVLAWRAHDVAERRRVELVASLDGRIEAAAELRRRGRPDAARAELEAARRSAETLDGEALLQARLAGALAVLDNHQQRWADALARLDEAEAWLARASDVPPVVRASVLNARAYASGRLGRADRALAEAERALEHARAALPLGHELRTDALLELADQHSARGEREIAFPLYDEAIEGLRARGDARDSNLGAVLNSLGVALGQAGRHADGLARLDEARDVLGFHLGAGDPALMQIARNRAFCLRGLGRRDEARAELERALARYRELERPFEAAESLCDLAGLDRDDGAYARAVERYVEARALFATALTPRHPVLSRMDHWTAEAHELAGDTAAARALWERALGPPHPVGAYGPAVEGAARAGLGRVLLASGEPEAARAELERAAALLERAHGAEHPETIAARALLGR